MGGGKDFKTKAAFFHLVNNSSFNSSIPTVQFSCVFMFEQVVLNEVYECLHCVLKRLTFICVEGGASDFSSKSDTFCNIWLCVYLDIISAQRRNSGASGSVSR